VSDRDLLDLFTEWRDDVDSVPFAHEQVWIDMFSDCVDGGR
jgi:hypothetical protein